MLNLFANELGKEAKANASPPMVIRFNPWNFSSLDSLISMFFHELESGMGRSSDPKLAKNLQKSMQALSFVLSTGEFSPVGGSFFGAASKLLNFGSKALDKKPESLEDIKARINKILRQNDRRIFIIIDDIDRLDQESMRYLFRLVRLNADFDRVTYVLAFDRNVVESVLTLEQGVSGQEYLEKIVQAGFDVPPAEPAKLKGFFLEVFDSLGFLAEDDEENKIRWVDLEGAGLYKLLRTPRDVVRYTNGLAVNGAIVSDEVNPIDFAALEAIRTFAPDLYAFIRENRDIFIGPTGGAVNLGMESVVEDQEKRFAEVLSLCKADVTDALRGICKQLFPEFRVLNAYPHYGSGYYEEWRKAMRICTVDFFPRYFYLRPSDEEVSRLEFDAIVRDAGDHAQLVVRLGELVDSGKIDSFLQRLADTSSELPGEYIESTVLALFDTGDKLTVGLRFENQLLKASRVVHKLLTRQKEHVRLCTLRTVAEKTTSLGMVVYFASLSSRSSQPEFELLNEEGWNEIRNDLVIRIKAAANEMALAQSPHLAILLYRWGEWGLIEDTQEFVRRLIESDDGVLAFLQGMMARRSVTVGEYATSWGWYIPLDDLREFVDPDDLTVPVQRIQSERSDDLSDLQRAAINAFLTAA